MKKHGLQVMMGIVVAMSFVGCFSVKPTATKTGGACIQTFYVGEEGMQYFIKPMILKGCGANADELAVDFTFRIKNQISAEDSAIANFSVYHEKPLKNAEALEFTSGTDTVKVSYPELLYTEYVKNLYVSRYSGNVDLISLGRVFNSEDWTVTYIGNNVRLRYCAGRKAQKTFREGRRRIFDMFDE